jgi:hypothetical protein
MTMLRNDMAGIVRYTALMLLLVLTDSTWADDVPEPLWK